MEPLSEGLKMKLCFSNLEKKIDIYSRVVIGYWKEKEDNQSKVNTVI
jgi:hypothetical protein